MVQEKALMYLEGIVIVLVGILWILLFWVDVIFFRLAIVKRILECLDDWIERAEKLVS